MIKENSILFLGDVVPYKRFKFKNSYQTVINLESPITQSGTPASGKINLRVENNYLKDIFKDNLLAVSLGNNHMLDFGKEGLEDTLKELTDLRTKGFGIENQLLGISDPITVSVSDLQVAFFSVICPSTSPITMVNNQGYLSVINVEKLIDDIRRIRKSVKRIVIYIHWGIEESSYASKEDILTARKLVDAGADIIIGCHAHAPQPIEKYNDGLISYGLGNFIMPPMKKIPTYYDKDLIPHSTYSKRLMPWNRTSWGLLIDLESMEYKIKKFIFIFGRILELPVTTFDRYLNLPNDFLNEEYHENIEKHLKKRAILRKIWDFVCHPRVPQRIKELL